jgi:hypothetical protein
VLVGASTNLAAANGLAGTASVQAIDARLVAVETNHATAAQGALADGAVQPGTYQPGLGFTITTNSAVNTNAVVVSGAGSAEANGTYYFNGSAYTNATLQINEALGQWEIGTLYYSTSASVTGTWDMLSGEAPAPTVTYGVLYTYTTNTAAQSFATKAQGEKADTALQSIPYYNVTSSTIGIGEDAVATTQGTAIGRYADALTYGVAFGYTATARERGTAFGYGAKGAWNGNVALGYNAVVNDTGDNGMRDTAMIGTGTAVSNGWLHYRGTPVIGPTGQLRGEGSAITWGGISAVWKTNTVVTGVLTNDAGAVTNISTVNLIYLGAP